MYMQELLFARLFFSFSTIRNSITACTCQNDSHSIQTSLYIIIDQLLLVPRSGTILGGTPVRVYGPCVQTPKNVKCVFDTKDVEGKYYPDRGQFVCVTPRFEKTGRVQLTLTFTSDDGEEQSHTGIFSVGKFRNPFNSNID